MGRVNLEQWDSKNKKVIIVSGLWISKKNMEDDTRRIEWARGTNSLNSFIFNFTVTVVIIKKHPKKQNKEQFR